jgi:hypothetical protein
MKSFIQAIAVAAVLAVPAISFAQSSVPVDGSAAASSYGGVADGSSVSGSHHALRSFDRAVHRVDNKIRASIRPDANDGMKPVFFGS